MDRFAILACERCIRVTTIVTMIFVGRLASECQVREPAPLTALGAQPLVGLVLARSSA